MVAEARARNSTLMVVLLFTFLTGYLKAQKIPALKLASTVSGNALADGGEKAIILATDVSPDASSLAIVFAVAQESKTSPVYRDLWFALWDIRANKLLKRTLLGRSEQIADVFTVGPSDVRFTENAVAVVALGRVWLVAPSDGSTHDAFSASRPGLGIPSQILLASDSIFAVKFVLDSQHFRVVGYDIASGSEAMSWNSTVVPESFSTDAQLAVAPTLSTYNDGGVSNIAILNAVTGQVLRSVSVGFAFPKSLLGERNAHGTAIARFINDKEIVAVPDGNRDSAGHHSGEGAEVINAIDGRIERRISLDGYGATDTVAESADRKWLAFESIYASPMWFSIESTNPSHYVHSLRLLKTDASDSQLAVAWPLNQPDLNSLPVLSVPPRISSMGPTVAITVGNEISVFTASK
jgi:hypothetical protein